MSARYLIERAKNWFSSTKGEHGLFQELACVWCSRVPHSFPHRPFRSFLTSCTYHILRLSTLIHVSYFNWPDYLLRPKQRLRLEIGKRMNKLLHFRKLNSFPYKYHPIFRLSFTLHTASLFLSSLFCFKISLLPFHRFPIFSRLPTSDQSIFETERHVEVRGVDRYGDENSGEVPFALSPDREDVLQASLHGATGCIQWCLYWRESEPSVRPWPA